MVTTIQVQDTTLELLKKLKEETKADSYDDAITKIVMARTKNESLAGYLGKHLGKDSLKSMLIELKKMRHESDRF